MNSSELETKFGYGPGHQSNPSPVVYCSVTHKPTGKEGRGIGSSEPRAKRLAMHQLRELLREGSEHE